MSDAWLDHCKVLPSDRRLLQRPPSPPLPPPRRPPLLRHPGSPAQCRSALHSPPCSLDLKATQLSRWSANDVEFTQPPGCEQPRCVRCTARCRLPQVWLSSSSCLLRGHQSQTSSESERTRFAVVHWSTSKSTEQASGKASGHSGLIRGGSPLAQKCRHVGAWQMKDTSWKQRGYRNECFDA